MTITTLIVLFLILFFGIAILKNVLKIIFLILCLLVILWVLDFYNIIDIQHDILNNEPSIEKQIEQKPPKENKVV